VIEDMDEVEEEEEEEQEGDTSSPPDDADSGKPKYERKRGKAVCAAPAAPFDASAKKVVIDKSAAQRTSITAAMGGNILFSSCAPSERDEIVDAMASVTVVAGQDVIVQGDPEGEFFYILDSGEADIVVEGNVVGSKKAGESFGELALMYNAPRPPQCVPRRTWSCGPLTALPSSVCLSEEVRLI